MARRSSSEQNKHNQEVRRVVKNLKSQGYKVQADLPGYDNPDPIGKYGFVPDVTATKNRRTKLIEVETPSSVNRDKKQHSAFRRSAAQRPNATFDIVVTDG